MNESLIHKRDFDNFESCVERCARCGHETPTCPRCDREWPLLGGYVSAVPYCHTFVETSPTCYESVIGRLIGDLGRSDLKDVARRLVDEVPQPIDWAATNLNTDEVERWVKRWVERWLDEVDDAPTLATAATRPRRFVRACTCECASGGFCGGCGHAGCGRR